MFAEEVVQEVFFALWRDPSKYDPARGGFASWLLATTHHKSVTLVVRPTGVDMVSDRITPNAAGKKYWLWALDSATDSSPEPIVGFDVRSTGVGLQTLRPSQSGLDQVPDFAVSLEDAGRTPTEPSGVLAFGEATG